MNVVWRRLNESIESRPAWQEALIVGVGVVIVLACVSLAEGKATGAAVRLAVVGGLGAAIGSRIGRPVRARRRARRVSSN
jgi:hypothetical protein